MYKSNLKDVLYYKTNRSIFDMLNNERNIVYIVRVIVTVVGFGGLALWGSGRLKVWAGDDWR